MSVWQVQEAKSRFSEVLDRAKTEGPQTITKHGMETAVVMSMEEYRRLAGPKKDFIQHLLHRFCPVRVEVGMKMHVE